MKRPSAAIVAVLALALLGFVGWGVRFQVLKNARQAVDDMAANLAPYALFTHGEVDVSLLDMCMTVAEPEVVFLGGGGLRADSITIYDADLEHEMPRFVEAEINGLTAFVDRPGYGWTLAALAMMQREEVRADLRGSAMFDPEADRLTIGPLTADLDSGARINLCLRLESVDLDGPRSEQMLGARLGASSLLVADPDLSGKLMRRLANAWGVDQDEALRRADKLLTREAERLREDWNQQAADALEGLLHVLEGPATTASITLAPDEPVPLLYFFMGRDIYDMLKLLRVTIQAEEVQG